MISKPNFFLKINTFLNSINSVVEEIIRRSLIKTGSFPLPVLNTASSLPSTQSSFNLNDILDNGFTWYCPTPKHRTSAEKKLTKKFNQGPHSSLTKYCTPKQNITECFECGAFHEIGKLCQACYEKVKDETEKLYEEMFKDDKYQFNYPAKEVKFLYDDDNKEQTAKSDSKNLFVEIPKKRPSWFSNDLTTKIATKN